MTASSKKPIDPHDDAVSIATEPAWRWWLRFVMVPLLVAVLSAIILSLTRNQPQTIIITATAIAPTDTASPNLAATLQMMFYTATAAAQSIVDSGQTTPALIVSSGTAVNDTATESATPPATGITEPPPTDQLLPVFTCLAPAWAGYYPLQLIEAQGIDQQLGFDLRIIAAGYPGQHDYTEDEMAAALAQGEIDCLFNTLDSLALRGNYGVLTAFVDEVAGADEIWVRDPAITTINDLSDKRISFAGNSTAEYMAYYWLAIPGLLPKNITANVDNNNICPQTGSFYPMPADSTQAAVAMFQRGEVDAVLGWQPEISLAQAADTRKLADDRNIRMSLDVLLVSHQAVAARSTLVQRFHEAWFIALHRLLGNPNDSAQALLAWANAQHPDYADWMGLDPSDPAGSLQTLLQPIAQATLLINQVIFDTPTDIYDLLQYQQQIWRSGGRTNVVTFDYPSAIDTRFVESLRGRTDLTNHAPPINNDFSFGAQTTADTDATSQTLVNLPLIFNPNDSQLSETGRQVLERCIVPILRHTTANIKVVISASSAWPGPTGTYTEADIRAYAQQRAKNVKLALVNNQINPSQIIEEIIIPPVERQNILDQALMVQDRFVRIRLEEFGR